MVVDLGLYGRSAFTYLTLCALVLRLALFSNVVVVCIFFVVAGLLMHVAMICCIRVLYSCCSNVGLMAIWFGFAE